MIYTVEKSMRFE